MSATISKNNLKFVIFGAGHDYTLADSGEGEKVFYSHHFVPLNAKNYAGMYYFLAPVYDPNDETAEPVMTDVVKDDIAHCTFDPAIDSVFSTAGEQTIKVHYRREYVYAESTILVDKVIEQTIEVVDHGAVSTSSYTIDTYADGYGFIHPTSTTDVQTESYTYYGYGIKKISSIPWRKGTSLINFLNSSTVEDISELAYADVSGVRNMKEAFKGCEILKSLDGLDGWVTKEVTQMQSMFEDCFALEDISAIRSWNTSNVASMKSMFQGCHALEDVSAVADWDTVFVGSFAYMFADCDSLTDLTQISSLNVSNATVLSYMFAYSGNLETLDGLDGWNTSSVQQMDGIFSTCSKLSDVSAIANWDVSKVRNMSKMFESDLAISDFTPIAGWTTSSLYNVSYMFSGGSHVSNLRNVDFLADWDVSHVSIFKGMFKYQYWLSDISGLSAWDTSAGTDFFEMFDMVCGLRSLSDLASWNMANATNLGNMFIGYMVHSTPLDEDLYQYNSSYYAEDGTEYAMGDTSIRPITDLTTDCSALEGWTVNIPSPTGVVPSNDTVHYINQPSWG